MSLYGSLLKLFNQRGLMRPRILHAVVENYRFEENLLKVFAFMLRIVMHEKIAENYFAEVRI